MKRKKLVIISHTEHYIHNETIKGWGSTINEINYLAHYWDEIVHIGCLYNEKCPPSSLPYTEDNIRFVSISPFGGKRFIDKIKIFFILPTIIKIVLKNIKNATEIQLRLPTSMGLFLLPLFSFFIPRKFVFWVKYAGNWNQKKPPISYRLQRWWLKNNFAKCKVTINGTWKNQPSHCISFENPCLTSTDIQNGLKVSNAKNFIAPFRFIFIGRLDNAKGVDTIIKSLEEIPFEKIESVTFVGDGSNLEIYKKETAFLQSKVNFKGFLNQEAIHHLLKESHFIVLPSKSEGFPKVIAEAACYGVIPIVSNVGSIPHFITQENGFVWNINSKVKYSEIIFNAINDLYLQEKSKKLSFLAQKFTFENYIFKLNKYILK